MATITFVALQCYQCSTMQVKQRKKKSSNKWRCVVCNEKQSVVRVFGEGPSAKDLRKFVQSFNMSRKFADQNQPFHPTSDYDTHFEDDDATGDPDQNQNQRKKRRTDWTQYLDPDDHPVVLHEEEQGGDLELKIVTELPAEEKYESGENPRFSIRNSTKDALLISQDEKLMRRRQQQQQAIGSTTRSGITIGIGEESAKRSSKWKHYITDDDDDDDCGVRGRINSADHHMNKWGDSVLEGEPKYEKVDDDIHPDFM